jgi:hypothetical protein
MLPIVVEKLTLSDEARKFLPPAPPQARAMAARGLAPLSPADLITVQVVLTADADEAVAAAARQNVAAHPEAIMKAAAAAIPDAAVLDYLSYCAVPAPVKEAILLNKAVANETLVHIAKDEKDANVLDVLSNNQKRMLALPEIAESLIENPALSFATRKRLEEFFVNDFADQFLADTQAAPAGAPAEAAAGDLHAELAAALAGVALEGESTPVDAAELAKAFLEEKADDAKADTEAEGEAVDTKKLSVYKQILNMRVSGKIKLALKGNKEARSILVKDSNKMVCTGVLKNSRITDGEVATIASSKSSIEDLLRIIGSNPAWMRNYNIRLALLNNPKTPFGISQKMLSGLHEKDIEAISKSRGVSGALRQMAERIVRAKKKSGGH